MLEPQYTIATERYVDLSRFCNIDGAKSVREEIIRYSDSYRQAYRQAYRILRIADSVDAEYRLPLQQAADHKRLIQRIRGIIGRELRGKKAETKGRRARVFLGGLTHSGQICRFDSVEALCPRIYALTDNAGIAAPLLEMLQSAANDTGLDTIACLNPNRPQEMEHLLIPSRGLAFITDNVAHPYRSKAYRHIRLDAAAMNEVPQEMKAKLRLNRKLYTSLLEDAVAALQQAKQQHDKLETVYHPYIDFDSVHALAEEELARILG